MYQAPGHQALAHRETAPNIAEITVSALDPRDRSAWSRLFRGHLDACGDANPAACVDQAWTWLSEPNPQLHALLAWSATGEAVGLAHYQRMLRTRHGEGSAYMSDLFVAPEWRCRGVARDLVAAVIGATREHGWGSVRWLTASRNMAGQALYAHFGDPTPDLVYDIDTA